MSLFKTNIIKYGAMKYVDEYLLLHCSREECVKAPFNGELTKINGGYILSKDDFKLYITHIEPIADTTNVFVGDAIGIPMIGNEFGVNRAYASIKLYKNDNLEDVLKYIKYKDKTDKAKTVAVKISTDVKIDIKTETIEDEIKVEKPKEKIIEKEEVEKPKKKKSTSKRSTSKKKNTKK